MIIIKILHINSYYYSSSVHQQLQLFLHDHNIESSTYAPVSKGYVGRNECAFGCEDYVKKSECYNKVDRYFFHIKHQKILNDILRHYDAKNFHCIHAHSLFSNGYVARQLKMRWSIPYIVAVRDTDINVFFKRMLHLRKLGRQILQDASKIVFLSIGARDNVLDNYVPSELRNSLLAKSIIIPNGIDDFWLQNKFLPKNIKKRKSIRLLHVGAISKRKNLLNTAKAVEILVEKGHDVQYTVVGKIMNEKVFKKIQAKSFVKYHPPKNKEELLEIYRENDIFVMPSITETFGLVYPEAMSQGLPVIYTKDQGFDGQFNEGEVGYPVFCNDPYDIAEQIENIMGNYNGISKKCIVCVDRFNWADIAKVYIEQYDAVINS